MKARKKRMIVFGIIITGIVLIAVFFVQPFSALKSDFRQSAEKEITHIESQTGEFTNEDISGLPEPVQNYFIHCGYIGTPKMSYTKITFKNVRFSTEVNKPTLKMDYTQYNFVEEPVRLAFINSSLFGIPFQGFDSFQNGTGSMKGVIAKVYTLFDQRGTDMDKACLATVLSESLIVPDIALQKYIHWDKIDNTHAKATISYYGMTASGIFAFKDNGEMISFTTDDRAAIDFDGNKKTVPWSAVCNGYTNNSGILQPHILQAVWHYPEGDLIYFDGVIEQIEYH